MARLTHPLNSSGHFLESASINETAAVTTPKCESLSRCTIREAVSLGVITSLEVRNSLSKQRAALCFTESTVSL